MSVAASTSGSKAEAKAGLDSATGKKRQESSDLLPSNAIHKSAHDTSPDKSSLHSHFSNKNRHSENPLAYSSVSASRGTHSQPKVSTAPVRLAEKMTPAPARNVRSEATLGADCSSRVPISAKAENVSSETQSESGNECKGKETTVK